MDIITRVQKLLALAANNTNVNEAAVAAAKAQELISQHQLDMAQLAVDAGNDSLSDEEIRNDFTPLYEGQRSIAWKSYLADIVAKNNNCRIFLKRGNIHVVGKSTSVEITRFLFAYISGEIERLCERAMKNDRGATGKAGAKTWSNNFKIGAVEAIEDSMNKSKVDVQKNYAGTTAMTLVRKEDDMVADWLAFNMKLRQKQPHHIAGDKEARVAGYVAGSTIDVNRNGLNAGQSIHKLS